MVQRRCPCGARAPCGGNGSSCRCRCWRAARPGHERRVRRCRVPTRWSSLLCSSSSTLSTYPSASATSRHARTSAAEPMAFRLPSTRAQSPSPDEDRGRAFGKKQQQRGVIAFPKMPKHESEAQKLLQKHAPLPRTCVREEQPPRVEIASLRDPLRRVRRQPRDGLARERERRA